MTISSSIVTNVTKVIDSASRTKDKHDYERVGEKSDGLTIAVENDQKISEIQNNDSSIELILPSNIQTTTVATSKDKNPSNKRWIVLTSFSLLSFSNAVLWITFGPCLFIFMDHYK